MENTNDHISVNEWADSLNLSMRVVRKDIKSGLLKTTKIGAVYVARKSWIDEYLKKLSSLQTKEK